MTPLHFPRPSEGLNARTRLHRCDVWPAIDRLGVGWFGGRTTGLVDQARKEITSPCDLLFSMRCVFDYSFFNEGVPCSALQPRSNRSA